MRLPGHRRNLAWVCLVSLSATACGEAVFTPECRIPQRGELARPADAVRLPDGGFAVINFDPDELFCGGFISRFDANGNETADPQLLPVDDKGQQYEANFATIATTATRIWVAGQRYFTILGIRLVDRTIDRVIAGTNTVRVFGAGPDHFVAYEEGVEPGVANLVWYDDAGTRLESLATSNKRLLATTYDVARKRVWLGYGGTPYVEYVDLPDFELHKRSPMGQSESHFFSSMVVVGDVAMATDYAKALVVSWSAETGEPLSTEPVGVRPVALEVGSDQRLWLLDRSGQVYLRDNAQWRLVASAVLNPTAIVPVSGAAWVLDFANSALFNYTVN